MNEDVDLREVAKVVVGGGTQAPGSKSEICQGKKSAPASLKILLK